MRKQKDFLYAQTIGFFMRKQSDFLCAINRIFYAQTKGFFFYAQTIRFFVRKQ